MTMLYNFTTNQSAKYLEQKLGINFRIFKEVSLKVISGVPKSKITVKNGYSFFTQGEDQYLMFHYKRKYYTSWMGLTRRPKFHPFHCENLEKYVGYEISNRMPVDIFSRNEGKIFRQEKLSICGDCKKELFKSWFGKEYWYDAVLKFVEDQENPTFKVNGYHSMWSQISEAYREKRNWTCEKCHITLKEHIEKRYLHTHHINGNIEDNRTENFESLCCLCHALEHPEKVVRGTGFLEVDEFISNFDRKLDPERVQKYAELKRNNY